MFYTKLVSYHLGKLNIVAECQELRWQLWQCPPFLFLLLGFATIVSMVGAALLTSRYFEDPEEPTIIIASFVATLFLIIGNLIINGFNKIAEANRMKSEFVSIISHQLRSPLSILKWTLDVLSQELRAANIKEKLEEANKAGAVMGFFDTLELTTENMIKMVNSLLESSRIEARTFVLNQDIFSLNDLTRSAVENFRKYAGASHVTIELQTNPAIPDIKADRERIAIVVQNLIDNAIRYTPSAGKAMIKTDLEEKAVRWSITDQGMGIPKEDQRFIFQKFFRAKNSKNTSQTQSHGSGIGLYIAKEIVEASKGAIGFTSEEGRGTTFWFTLPLIKK